MWVFVAAAILMVASELAGAVGTLFRTSTLADIVEELAELVAIYSGDTALYLMSCAEREEISSLRRSANVVDDLTGLSSRSFFRRAAARRIELPRANDLLLASIVIEIDEFKPYNDLYGHGARDVALRCAHFTFLLEFVHQGLAFFAQEGEATLLLAQILYAVLGQFQRSPCAPQGEDADDKGCATDQQGADANY
jgi:predicted signal transduction protein with EAL and GGDEF domain